MAKKIVIIGGGILGLSTAYYCMRQGHKVTVIERGPATHTSCSHGNAGMIVPSHFVPLAAPGMISTGLRMMWNPQSPFFIRPKMDFEFLDWGWKFVQAATRQHVKQAAPLLRDLNLASRKCFLEIASLPQPGFGLLQRGMLMLSRTPVGFREEAHAAEKARELGLKAEVLTPGEAARLDPKLRMEIAGAVFYPDDCHLCPDRFMAALTMLLQMNGATLQWRTEVSGWHPENDRISWIDTDHGRVEADEFVVAAGSWSPSVVKELGVYLPMQPGKGYSLTLEHPIRLPEHCSILTEARVAVTPMGGKLRFGGTMELGADDDSINQLRVNGIVKSATKYFPDFHRSDFGDAAVWSGLRPCSPDGLPYLGRTRIYHNLSVATGHAMMGLSLGPISGKLLAEILSDQPPSADLTLLDPDRYYNRAFGA